MKSSLLTVAEAATTFLSKTHLTVKLEGKYAMITLISLGGMLLAAYALRQEFSLDDSLPAAEGEPT